MSSVSCLILTLTIFSFADESNHEAIVEYVEGPVVLQDGGGYLDASQTGTKLNLGTLLDVKTCFYAGNSHFVKDSINQIHVDLNAANHDNRPISYDYFVTFFDDEDNLLACRRYKSFGPLSPNNQNWSTEGFSIPRGLHKFIKYYKVALYESDLGIGKMEFRNSKPVSIESMNGDKGEGAQKMPPNQLAQKEQRGEPVKNGDRARLLFNDQSHLFKCETIEGPSVITNVVIALKRDEHVWVANQTDVRVHFQFKVNPDGELMPMAGFRNKTDKQRYCRYALAFFDIHGNLVCCNEGHEQELAPNGMMPTVSTNGIKKSNEQAFQGLSYFRLPQKTIDSITYFKMTIFESDAPIGTK